MARNNVNSIGRTALGRAMMGPPLPRVRPFSEMGSASTPVFGGYVVTMERNSEWIGQWKHKTASEIATNVSIVAAGLHYFLSLIARPKWKVVPASDEGGEAQKLAEYVEEVITSMDTPWPRVVRRSGMYRFHGFSIQEWTAIKRKDGKVGFRDVEPRSQYTIEQWTVADDGAVEGVWQRSPQTSQLLGIPRKKMLYLVEDTLTDAPDGMGILRHMAEPYNRLKKFLELETTAFERDLRGIPIGRAPLTAIREAIDNGKITKADGERLIQGMQDFVALQSKTQETGMLLDSVPYTSVSTDGPKVSGLYQWSMELLQGSSNGLQELHNAIDRLQREMARIGGWESLMLGDGSGGANRALSEDKSKALYLIANAVLTNMANQASKDLIDPLWDLNGFDEDLKPEFQPEDVAFKDVHEISGVLRDMATAGAVLAPDDPVIDDMRDLLGVSRQPERDEEEMDAMVRQSLGMPTEMDEEQQELSIAQQRTALANPEGVGDVIGLDDPRGDKPLPSDEEDDETEKRDERDRLIWRMGDLVAVEDEDEIEKGFDPNQPREPKGSPIGGRWATSGGVDPAKITDRVWDKMDPREKKKLLEELRIKSRELFEETVGVRPEERHKYMTGSYEGELAWGQGALGQYTDLDYWPINAYLRDRSLGLESEERSTIRDMDKMFARASLPEDMQVTRYVDKDVAEMIRNAPGGVFEDKAFVSTTISARNASEGVKRSRATRLTINLPKGSKALPILHLADDYAAPDMEVLINRGSKFDVEVGSKGQIIMNLRVKRTRKSELEKAFDENKIRRTPRGKGGGQFASKPGAGGKGGGGTVGNQIPAAYLIRVEVEPDVWITLDRRKLGGRTPREAAIDIAVQEGKMKPPKSDADKESEKEREREKPKKEKPENEFVHGVVVEDNPEHPKLVAAWKSALAAMPQEHRDQIDATLRSVTEIESGAGGLHRIESGKSVLLLARNYMGRQLHDLEAVATHELGHALHDTSYGNDLFRAIEPELSKVKLSAAEQKAAGYFWKSDTEKFAELYNLAYSPSKGVVFGMPRDVAAKKFAKVITALKEAKI